MKKFGISRFNKKLIIRSLETLQKQDRVCI